MVSKNLLNARRLIKVVCEQASLIDGKPILVTASTLDRVMNEAKNLLEQIQKARKAKYSLASHKFYAPKARSSMVQLQSDVHTLMLEYPLERFDRVAKSLQQVESLIKELAQQFPQQLSESSRVLERIVAVLDAEVRIAIESSKHKKTHVVQVEFLPSELFDKHPGPLRRILAEVNTTFDVGCYNACAILIRRIIETLLIEAFEHKGLADEIKTPDGHFHQLGVIITRATNNKKLGLGRNAKSAIPQLKFFGDLGAHNRNALVREADLQRLHNDTRIAIEELIHVTTPSHSDGLPSSSS